MIHGVPLSVGANFRCLITVAIYHEENGRPGPLKKKSRDRTITAQLPYYLGRDLRRKGVPTPPSDKKGLSARPV